MKHSILVAVGCCAAAALLAGPGAADEREDAGRLRPIDVFGLEYVSAPQISPDGARIVYVRNSMDIMKDKGRSNLWIVNFDGTDHRPLTSGTASAASPRWSPDSKRLLYVSSVDEKSQILVRWMDTGETATLTQVTHSPSGVRWSPDGQWIAFSMLVPKKNEPLAEMPPKPEGAEWAPEVKVIDKLTYRNDGSGYIEDGYQHLFVLPAEGGTPRQVTFGEFHHSGVPTWSADSKSLVFSANRHEDWEYDPLNTDIYEVRLTDSQITALTDRQGPDESPVVSPDGTRIAYLGFDDELMSHQISRLYVMNRDGSERRELTKSLDRTVVSPAWGGDSVGVSFQFNERGDTQIARVSLDGKLQILAQGLGGTSLGRPYSGGSFSLAAGRFAFTQARTDRPADLAVGQVGDDRVRRITGLNEDLLAHKELGQVEEITYASTYDNRAIHGWVIKPPGFDPQQKYPMILEIHGGPHANYGSRFSAEMQLYAAAGYVVLYTNPRGSTSYGEKFAQLIHHNYPGEDYDDLISGVDELIGRGYVDADRLFVTGGSGGGVLSSWIVGKTDRFCAAVVAKPVINWYSFALTADHYNYFAKYWFPGLPWEYPEHYLKRSSLSLVGNVKTPTMLIGGESDHRTPISEAEQYYQALKLCKVPTALVRIPGASHNIARRPSHMIAKVANVLAWFEKWDDKPAASDTSQD